MKTHWTLQMANNSMKTKIGMEELVAAIKSANKDFWLYINQALIETPAKFLIIELDGKVTKDELANSYKKFSLDMHNPELEAWLGIKHS